MFGGMLPVWRFGFLGPSRDCRTGLFTAGHDAGPARHGAGCCVGLVELMMVAMDAQTDAKTKARTVERGIVARHRRGCGVLADAGCSCRPSFQAMVWSARDEKPVRKTFGSARGAGMACACAGRPERRGARRAIQNHARGGGGAVAVRGGEWGSAHPLWGPVQAVGVAQLRAGPAGTDPAAVRFEATVGAVAADAAGPHR